VDFLGAGPIVLPKDAVQGLTTAASIWLVESLGLACGAGMHLASGTTVLALVILGGLKTVERRVFATGVPRGRRCGCGGSLVNWRRLPPACRPVAWSCGAAD